MVKIGDKVIVVSAHPEDNCSVGDVLEVSDITNPFGFWAETPHGWDTYARTKEMPGGSSVIVKPYTEIEAERRGARFGVMGVVKDSGTRISFVKEYNGLWRVFDENGIDYDFKPSEIRLDHEPEFIAWAGAPERLKYDASRVYFEGEPVKWIAKPEGAWSNVAFVNHYGVVQGSPDDLTVKL